MVDVRPLIFANALFLMLLITAGFAHISSSDIPSGSSLPSTAVHTTDGVEQNEKSTKIPIPMESKKKIAIKKALPPTTTQQPIAEEISDEDIFADAKLPEPKALKHPQQYIEQPVVNRTNLNDRTTKPAINTSIKAPTPIAKVVEAPTPIAKPKPKPKPKAIPTTGTLVVRSNVGGDTVLINGKPYGPTKMEVNLPPGSYSVEVAKNGYTSWKKNVVISRGANQTLKARLEHYTTVDYRKGEWINGITTGEGSYVADDGTRYQGGFVNGKFHGTGSIRYPDGTEYRGQWFEGTMQGEGTLHTNQSDSYIGNFKDGEFSGEGTLTKVNSDIYTGYWVSGSLNGQGSLTTKDGLLFVGGFSDNQFHGEGSLTYPDGRHYEGSFSKGQFHGKGIEIYANGKKYVGQFMEGNYHGKGELMNPNGSKITGTFKFGQPFGKATLTTPEGEIFTARTTEPGVCYRLKSYRATQCPPMEGW